jgi:hypothetical protein
MELKCEVTEGGDSFYLKFEGDEAVIRSMWAYMCVELPCGRQMGDPGKLDVSVPKDGYWTNYFDAVPRTR